MGRQSDAQFHPEQGHAASGKSCPCPGPSRRDFLKVGFIGGLGMTLGDYFLLQNAQADGEAAAAKAQSVIYIFMGGGMSHIDTFDPKPYAPIEYRGELGSVKTVTGDVFGGQLQRIAGIADKISVIRSMTHGEAAHERGTHNMFTGYRPSPAIQYPSFGSVVSHELGSRNNIPPYVAIPNVGTPYMGTGYLSSAYAAFSVGGEPVNDGFQVRDLNLADGVSPERMEARKSLLASVDAHFSSLEKSDALEAMNSYYQRAYSLISSQQAREAFQIAAEPDAMRDTYGRHAFGQRLLLARRLVEGGARFITVSDGGWDMHKNIKADFENRFPQVDQGITALIQDLESRGLLASTMVVVATEFGRTAKLNPDGGRDHWPKAFSVMIAGGGIKGGVIHGETDPRGAEPVKDPVGPADLAATIYTQLGIAPGKRLMSAGNRPIDLVRDGKIITQLV
ncbi:MAG: DUF1501 domain-containing protein [Candidatus Hydrogenedentes bacterium]|nr:DUF1501 domain-containing protein [Candidatus Hydrogenedentota bacterium]